MFTKFVDPDDRTPRNVSHWDLTSTSVTLTWQRPLYPNLLNYTLAIRIDPSLPFLEQVINANETNASVKELKPNTLFSATLVPGYADGSLGDTDLHYFQTPPSGKLISKSFLFVIMVVSSVVCTAKFHCQSNKRKLDTSSELDFTFGI